MRCGIVCSNGGMIGVSSTRLRRTENILGLLSRMSLWIRIRIRTSTVIFILIIHYIYIMNMPYIVIGAPCVQIKATNQCHLSVWDSVVAASQSNQPRTPLRKFYGRYPAH